MQPTAIVQLPRHVADTHKQLTSPVHRSVQRVAGLACCGLIRWHIDAKGLPRLERVIHVNGDPTC